MDNASIIEKTRQYVEDTLKHDSSGHDWWHIYRVWHNARYLAQYEGGDLFVIELAALLHDIADWKFHADDKAGVKITRAWLTELQIAEPIITHVCQIIDAASFKGAKVVSGITTLEGKIVQDADRLDALGAIGIARTFAYGGSKGRMMHDPHAAPVLHESFEAYKKHQGSTINHFHEKLFLLKDLMNTATAKKLAEKRHVFMENFMAEFLAEWELTEE